MDELRELSFPNQYQNTSSSSKKNNTSNKNFSSSKKHQNNSNSIYKSDEYKKFLNLLKTEKNRIKINIEKGNNDISSNLFFYNTNYYDNDNENYSYFKFYINNKTKEIIIEILEDLYNTYKQQQLSQPQLSQPQLSQQEQQKERRKDLITFILNVSNFTDSNLNKIDETQYTDKSTHDMVSFLNTIIITIVKKLLYNIQDSYNKLFFKIDKDIYEEIEKIIKDDFEEFKLLRNLYYSYELSNNYNSF